MMDRETLEKVLILRLAELRDAEIMYLWRNSQDSKINSFNTEEIAWETHQQWLSDSLQKKDRIILIGEVDAVPVGVLRLDILNDEAEVGIYLDPSLYGKGLGTLILQSGRQWLQTNRPEIHIMTAKVLHTNVASQKAFVKAGFEEFYHVYRSSLTKID